MNSNLSRFGIPATVAVLMSLYLMVAMTPPQAPRKEIDWPAAGAYPILDHGRTKPLDTLARTSLLLISNREYFMEPKPGYVKKSENEEVPKESRPAIKWLLDVMTANSDGKVASKLKKFRIEDTKLQAMLGLEPRRDALFAFAEFDGKENLKRLVEAAGQANGKAPDDQNAHDKAALELYGQVLGFAQFVSLSTPHEVFRVENEQVLALMGLEPRAGFRYSFDEIVPRLSFLIKEGLKIKQRKMKGEKDFNLFETKLLQMFHQVELYMGLARIQSDSLLIVPPNNPGEEWQTLGEALELAKAHGTKDGLAQAFEGVLSAYASGRVEDFNQRVAEYREKVAKVVPEESAKANFESSFNQFGPFSHCTYLYIGVIVLTLIYWLTNAKPLNDTAFWMMISILVLHTWALIARMYLLDRWLVFVTNLYSSAVFIGWGGVGMGILLELIFKNGVGNVVGAVVGFLSLLIASGLAVNGDTLEMMQAVLDTNFWLATHVTTVTFGYAATFVAGQLGVAYVLMRLSMPILVNNGMVQLKTFQSSYKMLGTMIYGIVCFATLLSFIGTVLGGIWADQSWGRFWGWDPKENGALIIVLWNALILHARWGGMAKSREMAVLAIFGNIVTSWSWFGVNMLGVGLHSYGFMEQAFPILSAYVGSQLLFIVLGMLPVERWVKKELPKPTDSAPPVPEPRKRHRR